MLLSRQERTGMLNRKINIEWINIPSTLYIFVAGFILFSIANSQFLSVYNWTNILIQSSILCTITLGVTIVIISGGMDLSVGNVLTLSGVICGVLMSMNVPVGLSIIGGVLTGVVCGFANGLMITKMGLPPFIATLAMMNIAAGFSNTLSERKTVYWEKEFVLNFIGNEKLLGIPVFIILSILIVIVVIFIFKKTILGVYVYAIGGNEEVLRFAGINTVKWKLIIYSLSGLLAGIAGILMNSRLGCADPIVGSGYEFYAVVSAIIGGNILRSGKGSLLGGVLGVVTLTMIRNGFSLMGLLTHWQMVIVGLILIFGMLINEIVVRRAVRVSLTA